MNYRLSQNIANIVLSVPLIKKNGEQASGLTLTTISVKIISPNGTAVTGFTPPIITEPNGDGIYVLVFPSTAAVKAFAIADTQNPYVVSVSSTDTGVEPTTVNVMIVPTDYLNNFMQREERLNIVRTVSNGGNRIKVALRDYRGNPISGVNLSNEVRVRIIGEWVTDVEEQSPSGTHQVDGEELSGAPGWYLIRTANYGLPESSPGVLIEDLFPCWTRVEISPEVSGRFIPVFVDIANYLQGAGKP